MQDIPTVSMLFDTDRTIAAALLVEDAAPWAALTGLTAFIRALGPTLPVDEYDEVSPEVWIAKDATVASSASVSGPCIIDHGAEIRHCAFIRGSALVGKEAIVGNSTELKNALLFDRVQVPHYNYVGDSILGYGAHMGAGSITSNVKSDKTLVTVMAKGGRAETGLRKFGALIGDGAEIGCNSVLNPGTIVGRGCIVYPLSNVRGVLPERHIYKHGQAIVPMVVKG